MYLLLAMDFREFAQEISKRRHIPDETGDLIIGLMVLSAGLLLLWSRNVASYGIDSLRIERMKGVRRIMMEATVWIGSGVLILWGVVQLIAYLLGIPLFR